MTRRASPIRAVVFDHDGLMFNTEELYQEVGTTVLARRGRDFPTELIRRVMGRPTPVALQMMIDWHALDATPEQLAAESREVFAALLDARLAPMPGLLDLLSALETAGVPKAIATGSRRAFVTEVLGRYDLEPRFEFLLTSDEVLNGKPHPEIYETAARRLGHAPEAVLVLEDSEHGCQAAVAAGTVTVAVPGPASHVREFPGVRLVAESLADPRLYELLGL